MVASSFALLLLCWSGAALALDNGLGRVPQMGYNSWYDLMDSLDEQSIRETATALVSTGLAKLGFTYVNLDDCWAAGRYPNGSVYADQRTFPSKTLAPLASFVHGLGLKFGTYTDRGTKTCAGRPGSLDHEKIDADTYASWGIDYVKEDSCYATDDHDTAFSEYGAMRDALNSTGRPIFFSLCGWNPWYAPVGKTLGNSWRIGPDDTNWPGVLANININAALGQFAGPGGWNDPCLLLAETYKGDLRMTHRQTRTQFNFWAVMASPMLISANVRNMSAENLATYSNAEVIAIDQDPLGVQGVRLVGGALFPVSDDSAALAARAAGMGAKPASARPGRFSIKGKRWYTPGFDGSAGPAQVLTCDASNPKMQWSFDAPAGQYLFNNGTNKCLNVDNCQNDLILFDCVTEGGTCCGATCYKNMQFSLTSDHTLVSPVQPGQCAAMAADGSVNLVPCVPGSPTQYWSYDPQTHLIHYGQSSNLCLSSASGSVNVWGRKITQGWAVLFVNTGDQPSDVTCDQQCFSSMGFAPGAALRARDVWLHTTFAASASGYTAAQVPEDGGSVLIIFSQA